MPEQLIKTRSHVVETCQAFHVPLQQCEQEATPGSAVAPPVCSRHVSVPGGVRRPVQTWGDLPAEGALKRGVLWFYGLGDLGGQGTAGRGRQ